MKKFRLLFTTLLLSFGWGVAWADAVEIDGIYYNLDANADTAEVTANPSKYSGQVVIPATVTNGEKTYTVTSIGEKAFYSNRDVTDVQLGSNIRVIRNQAFMYTNITSINLPASLREIQWYAFYNSKLESIELPASLMMIGYDAFSRCQSLRSITIPASVTSIGRTIVAGCTSMESIVVEEGNPNYDSRGNCNAIISKKNNALMVGCKNTVIPSDVAIIQSNAFLSLTTLTSIDIPASVTTINFGAFQNSGLTSLFIPATVIRIDENPVLNCQDLKTIVVEEGNPNYDSRGNCNAIIRTDANMLMATCVNTEIPATVKSIGDMAFANRYDLTSFTVPEQINFIYTNAFSNCSELRDITIPDNVMEIGYGAFSSCYNLTTVKIGSGLKYMGGEVFRNCPSLTDIYLDALTVPETAYNTFNYINSYSTVKLHVPSAALADYKSYTNWSIFDIVASDGVFQGITSTFSNVEPVDIQNSGETRYANLYSEENRTWWGVYFSAPSDQPFNFTYLGGSEGNTSCVMAGGGSADNTLDILMENHFQVSGPVKKVIVNATGNIESFNVCLKERKGESNEQYAYLQNENPSSEFKDFIFNFDGSEYEDACIQVNIYGKTPAFIHSITIVQEEGESGPATSGTTGDLAWKVEELPGSIEIWKNNRWVKVAPYRLTISGNGFMEGYRMTRNDQGVYVSNAPWQEFPSITEVVVEEGALSIGSYAFHELRDLTDVSLPSTLRYIDNGAFMNSGISNIELPEGLERIGSSAFYWCTALKSIHIPSTVTTIESSAFQGNALETLTVALNNPKYDSRGDCNGIIETATNTLVVGTLTTAIPADVPIIGERAFYNMGRLTEVNIPEGVTTIGEYAFGTCQALKEVKLPSTVTTIGYMAFNYNTSMTKFTIGSGVTKIGSGVFEYCSKMDSVICYADPASLTWDGYANSSNFKKDKETLFLVKKSDLDAWQTAFPNLNATYVGEEEMVTTGISDNKRETINNRCYDLQGRQLSNSQLSNGKMKKGLYIINGRKVMIK